MKKALRENGRIIKISAWNVAGLRACIKKKAFLPYVQKYDPDILCLSETKCTRKQIGADFPNYKVIWNDCKGKAGYAGVGILSKFDPISVDISPLPDGLGDGRIILLEFESFYLLNNYVPNAGENLKFMERKRSWNDNIRKLLLKLDAKKPFIWTGDMNVAYLPFDVYDGETNKNRSKCAGFTDYEREHFTEYFDKFSYIDVYRKFYPKERDKAMTFWSYFSNNRARNRGWRLDYFIIPKRIEKWPRTVRVASEVLGSDHAPIEMEISVPGNLPLCESIKNENSFGINSAKNGVKVKRAKQTAVSRFFNIDKTEELDNKEKWEELNNIKDIKFGSWRPFLEKEFKKGYFCKLVRKIAKESFNKIRIFPPKKFVFNAFLLTPLDKIKVVILGQDPYHDDGQAHGLCFSVPFKTKPPPSLGNILKELHNDLGIKVPKGYGCLEKWAEQGVFLINSVLTVSKHKPNSHKKFGWQEFTDGVIKHISQNRKNVVFILWGKQAEEKKIIDKEKHFIISSPHPSPLSAHKGFFGSKPFSQTNRYLKENGVKEIHWTLKQPN